MKIFVSYFFQIKELILPQRANPIKSIMKKGKRQEYARNCYIIFSEYGKKFTLLKLYSTFTSFNVFPKK